MKTVFCSIFLVVFVSGCSTLKDESRYRYIETAATGDAGSQRFIKAGNLIGCGSVVSVRNVNQQPVYDDEYERQYIGRANSGSALGFLAEVGVVGSVVSIGAAAIAGGTADMISDANRTAPRKQKIITVPDNGKEVKAIRLRMDDGREINLPMLRPPIIDSQYEVGNRYQVFYSPTYMNLQLQRSREKDRYDTPAEAEKARKWFCSQDLDTETSNRELAKHKNFVDESKIY